MPVSAVAHPAHRGHGQRATSASSPGHTAVTRNCHDCQVPVPAGTARSGNAGCRRAASDCRRIPQPREASISVCRSHTYRDVVPGLATRKLRRNRRAAITPGIRDAGTPPGDRGHRSMIDRSPLCAYIFPMFINAVGRGSITARGLVMPCRNMTPAGDRRRDNPAPEHRFQCHRSRTRCTTPVLTTPIRVAGRHVQQPVLL